MNHLRWITIIFIFVIAYQSIQAHAHSPYRISHSDWLTTAQGRTHQMQALYGDGIFAADPVVLILIDDKDEIKALSPIGAQASGYCPSLDFCWGFTFDLFGIIPAIWRLDPDGVAPAAPLTPKDIGYPEYSKIAPFGFTRSLNYFMLPVAWMTLLPTIKMQFLIMTPLAIFFVIALHIFKIIKRLNPAKPAVKGLRYMGLSLSAAVLGMLCITIAAASIFYCIGFCAVVLFGSWWGILKAAKLLGW